GIDVNGIDRIADGNPVLVAEHVEDVAGVAFRAVGNEYFVVGDVAAPVAIVILGNSVAQEFVALFRTVTAKRFAPGHLIHRLVHGFDRRRRQRLGNIADATTDEPFGRAGILLAKDSHAPGDL